MRVRKAAKLKPVERININRDPLSYWPNAKLIPEGGINAVFNKPMKASAALKNAAEMVDGSREAEHGNKFKSFQHIAEMWTAYLGHPITGEQVCICMTLLKIGRTQHGTPNEDHYTDAAGYAAIAGELRLNGAF